MDQNNSNLNDNGFNSLQSPGDLIQTEQSCSNNQVHNDNFSVTSNIFPIPYENEFNTSNYVPISNNPLTPQCFYPNSSYGMQYSPPRQQCIYNNANTQQGSNQNPQLSIPTLSFP